jgi:hypothetical protein
VFEERHCKLLSEWTVRRPYCELNPQCYGNILEIIIIIIWLISPSVKFSYFFLILLNFSLNYYFIVKIKKWSNCLKKKLCNCLWYIYIILLYYYSIVTTKNKVLGIPYLSENDHGLFTINKTVFVYNNN